MLPLYEAKMIHHYDTRWATYEPDGSTRYLTEAEKADGFAPIPRYWVAEKEIDRKLDRRWNNGWFLGWRDVCRATDARTVIAACVPRVAYGDKWLLALPSKGRHEMLQAAWSSFVCDYAARQKIGGTSMKYFTFMQLPVPAPTAHLPHVDDEWVGSRVDRLNGWVADVGERAAVRAELDAYFFHLYGLARDDVDYVMETFPIVKRKDEALYGTFRTKDLILAAYDKLAVAAG
jgi:hypothetical protein